jgi:hypothetical protein
VNERPIGRKKRHEFARNALRVLGILSVLCLSAVTIALCTTLRFVDPPEVFMDADMMVIEQAAALSQVHNGGTCPSSIDKLQHLSPAARRIDPWDKPYILRCDSKGKPYVLSLGRDGKEGTEDDVRSDSWRTLETNVATEATFDGGLRQRKGLQPAPRTAPTRDN